MAAVSDELESIQDSKGVIEEVVRRSGFMVQIGTEVVTASDGRVTLQVHHSPALLQFDGLFHGGLIATLADYAGAGAAALSNPRRTIVLTSNINVTYLNPAKGSRLWAEAVCIKAGQRTRVSRVEVFTDESAPDRPVAVADVSVIVQSRNS